MNRLNSNAPWPLLLACLCMGAGAAQAGDAGAGKPLYETYCVSCHASNGNGKGLATKDMDRNPRSFVTADFKFDTDADWQRGTDADIYNAIAQGAEAFGGSPLMPAWGQVLSETQINDLVAYIRTLEK